MKNLTKIVDFILTEADSIEVKNLEQRVVKLFEEGGELAAAVLKHKKLKSTDMSKNEVLENILEEGCDVIIVALSILGNRGFTVHDVEEKLLLKIEKWKRVNAELDR